MLYEKTLMKLNRKHVPEKASRGAVIRELEKYEHFNTVWYDIWDVGTHYLHYYLVLFSRI